MSFDAQHVSPDARDEGRDAMPLPQSRIPATPPDFLELCRREFIKRWREDHPDDFEDATEVYGD